MVLVLYTADEVLEDGLLLYGFSKARQQRVKRDTNLELFRSRFGIHPVVVAQVWEDFQTTNIPAARIDTPKGNVSLASFLHTLCFLKTYPTENNRRGDTGLCRTTARKWGWYFVERMVALKADKVSVDVFTTDRPSDPLFSFTVGSHCLFCLSPFRSNGLQDGRRILLSLVMVFIVASMKKFTPFCRKIQTISLQSSMGQDSPTNWHCISGKIVWFG